MGRGKGDAVGGIINVYKEKRSERKLSWFLNVKHLFLYSALISLSAAVALGASEESEHASPIPKSPNKCLELWLQ